MRKGNADVLVVKSLDVISRDPDRILALLVEAASRGFYLCSLDERFDTSTFSGMVAEKCLSVLLAWARRKRIEDYRNGKDKLFTEAAPPSFRQTVDRIIELRIKNYRWARIATTLNQEGYQMRRHMEWTSNAVFGAYRAAIDLGMIDEVTLRPEVAGRDKKE